MGFWPQLCEWISFHGILGHILPTAMFKDSIAQGKKKKRKTPAKDNSWVRRIIMRKYTILWCKDIRSWQLYSQALSSKKLEIMCEWLITGELFQLTAAPEASFILFIFIYLGYERCLQPECIFFFFSNITFRAKIFSVQYLTFQEFQL